MIYILDLHFVISESNKKVFSSEVHEVRKGMHSICIPLQHNVALTGDIRVDFYNRPKMKRKVYDYSFYKNISLRLLIDMKIILLFLGKAVPLLV